MRNRVSHHRILPLFTFVVLAISLVIIVTRGSGKSEIISPLAMEINVSSSSPIIFAKASPIVKKTDKSETALVDSIKSYTEKQTGIYSVYIYDLTKKKGFGFNETTIFTAASVIKLPILATLYYEAQQGKIDLDRRITIQTKDIQDYGTGVIRYEGPGGVYSLKSLAQILIEKSDNTAAYVLTSILGEKRIQELADQWGLTQTDIHNNKTSNSDMARLMAKMYTGQITNQAFTQEMIGFMDDTDFENRLPALLPEDIKVYHKIGNEVGNIHDVGIVVLPNRTYYIGVMTNDVLDDASAEKSIAEISKMVYEYMK